MSEQWIATLTQECTVQVEFDVDELDAMFPDAKTVEEQVLSAVGEDFFGTEPFRDETITVGDVHPKAVPDEDTTGEPATENPVSDGTTFSTDSSS